MQRMIDAFKARLATNIATTAQRIREVAVPFYRAMPDAALRATVMRVFAAALADLEAGGTRSMSALLARIGADRSQHGVAVIDVLSGIHIGFQVVTEDFAAQFAADPEARLAWELARSEIAFAGAASLASEYLMAREAVVRAQAEELAELALRVLPLYPGILVLPLVGRISGERADQITEVLLAAISRHRCRFALLDLSGVAAFDTEVAGHLMRAAGAVRLLGATPVIVGLTVLAARTIAGLGDGGAALGQLITLADLESGLRYALTRMGVSWGPGPTR